MPTRTLPLVACAGLIALLDRVPPSHLPEAALGAGVLGVLALAGPLAITWLRPVAARLHPARLAPLPAFRLTATP